MKFIAFLIPILFAFNASAQKCNQLFTEFQTSDPEVKIRKLNEPFYFYLDSNAVITMTLEKRTASYVWMKLSVISKGFGCTNLNNLGELHFTFSTGERYMANNLESRNCDGLYLVILGGLNGEPGLRKLLLSKDLISVKLLGADTKLSAMFLNRDEKRLQFALRCLGQ